MVYCMGMDIRNIASDKGIHHPCHKHEFSLLPLPKAETNMCAGAKQRQFKRICLIIVFSMIASGCTLPLCEQNEIVCSYGLKDNCSELDCTCDPEKDNQCTQHMTGSDYTKSCILSKCENDIWQAKETCSFGFDGSKKECNPECINNDIKCTVKDIEVVENSDTACTLYKCINNEWTDIEYCYFGFSRESQKCKNECIDGETRCTDEKGNAKEKNDESHSSCTLRRCTQGKWPVDAEEVCTFGFDGNQCINPCTINGTTYSFLANSSQSNDSVVIVRCEKDTGWEIDNTCNNDFSYSDMDDAIHVQIPEWAASNQITDLIHALGLKVVFRPGKCGECNSDAVPMLCTDVGNVKVLHQCDNGIIQIAEDSSNICAQFLNSSCKDAYGQMTYVDLNTNRYHCGKCDNACSSNQICYDGQCKSKVTKESCINGYARLQHGARLIRAYCIDNVEELSRIPQRYPEDNYDNAYILVNDEELVLKDWHPIGPFQGMLFGNEKTIKIDSYNLSDDLSNFNIGMFKTIENAYVDGIHFKYIGDGVITIPNNKDSYAIVNFGLLAGNANDSVIRNINVTTSVEIQINNASIPLAGSNSYDNAGILLGQGDNVNLSNIHIKDFSFKNKMILSGESSGMLAGILEHSMISECTFSNLMLTAWEDVGIIVGNTHDSTFRDITLTDVNVDSALNAGGIAGEAHDSIFSEIVVNTIRINSNDTYLLDEPDVIGGIIGYSDNNKISEMTINDALIIGDKNIGGLIGIDVGSTIQNCDADDITVQPQNQEKSDVGGLVGNANQSSITGITFKNINVDCGTISNSNEYCGGIVGNFIEGNITNVEIHDETVTGNMNVGGLAGGITHSTVSNIFQDNVTVRSLSGYSGGMFGQVISTNIANTEISQLAIDSLYGGAIGGLAGTISDSQVYNSILRNMIIEAAGESIGGMAGRADSCQISDVRVESHKIKTSHDRAGGLIGSLSGNSTIRKTVTESRDIHAEKAVGGIIGHASGQISIGSSSSYSNMQYIIASSGFIGVLAADSVAQLWNNNIIANILSKEETVYSLLGVGGQNGILRLFASGYALVQTSGAQICTAPRDKNSHVECNSGEVNSYVFDDDYYANSYNDTSSSIIGVNEICASKTGACYYDALESFCNSDLCEALKDTMPKSYSLWQTVQCVTSSFEDVVCAGSCSDSLKAMLNISGDTFSLPLPAYVDYQYEKSITAMPSFCIIPAEPGDG